MHLALPDRKPSRPLASHQATPSYLPRIRLKTLAWMIAGFLFLIVLLSQFRGGRGQSEHASQQVMPIGTAPVVIVTTIDPEASNKMKEMISINRKEYATLHGYATFLPSITDYPLLNESSTPSSWAKIPAVRHAMAIHPHSPFFFYLDRTAMITNPSLSVQEHITNTARLESLMIPDQPVIPPDSVIKTPHTRRADRIDFVITQDAEGLLESSFIVRNGDWARFFLDSWYDPLYRSYNFQRADGHALEHLVQWHGTVLARMALVPQKIMNSYVDAQSKNPYSEGDFVANVHQCDTDGQIPCEAGLRPYYERFKQALPQTAR